MARYSKKASEKVEKAMHERKRGKLKSGRSGKKVKSRKQAIAIGLSQARQEEKVSAVPDIGPRAAKHAVRNSMSGPIGSMGSIVSGCGGV